MDCEKLPILWLVELVEQAQLETQQRRQITYIPREEEWYMGGEKVTPWSPQELEQRVSLLPPSSFVPDVSTYEGRLCATRQNLLSLLKYIVTRDTKHSELSM